MSSDVPKPPPPPTITVCPRGVRFTQRSVSPLFRDGRSVAALAQSLASGEVALASVPQIQVVRHSGLLYSLNNRRLLAFQSSGVDQVTAELVAPNDVFYSRLARMGDSDGTCVTVRTGCDASERPPPCTADLCHVITEWTVSEVMDRGHYTRTVRQIPESFASAEEYRDFFSWALLEDMRHTLAEVVELCSQTGEWSVLNDAHLSLASRGRHVATVSFTLPLRKRVEEVEAGVASDEAEPVLFVNDVVLLRKHVSRDEFVLGFVTRMTTEEGTRSASYVVSLNAQDAAVLTEIRAVWMLMRADSLTSHVRMFHALQTLPELSSSPIVRSLLCGEDTTEDRIPRKGVQCAISDNLNSSQARAVQEAMGGGVVVIQGPPGTGKTHVLIEILSRMVERGDRVFVCSPSNTAVDGIAEKVVLQGLHDASGEPMDPWIALVGSTAFKKLNSNTSKIFVPSVTKSCQELAVAISKILAPDETEEEQRDKALQLVRIVFMQRPQFRERLESAIISQKRKEILEAMASCFVEGDDLLADYIFQIKQLVACLCDGHTPKNSILEMVSLSCLNSSMCANIQISLERRDLQQLCCCAESIQDIDQELQVRFLEQVSALKQLLGKLSCPNKSKEDIAVSALQILDRCLALEPKIRRVLGEALKDINKPVLSSLESFLCNSNLLHDKIVENAQVVFGTLSQAGSRDLQPRERPQHFDSVLIDECGQSIEPETIIPTALSPTTMVLVGDHLQLPALVVSPLAIKIGLQRSALERLIDMNYPHTMLDVQYRMHPEIASLPSDFFYDGKLKNDHSVCVHSRRPWHSEPLLDVYRVLNVEGKEKLVGSSMENIQEVACVLSLLDKIARVVTEHPEIIPSVAVITPYRRQEERIEVHCQSKKYPFIPRVGTVDSFQGAEFDIVILSAVRANSSGAIGFLEEDRRLNVALTRAKTTLVVVCSVETLKNHTVWGAMIRDAKSRGRLHDAPISIPIELKTEILLAKMKLVPNGEFIWTVYIDEEARKGLLRMRKTDELSACKCIERLQSGSWRKQDGEGLVHLSSLKCGYCIVWVIDVDCCTLSQCLRVKVVAKNIQEGQRYVSLAKKAIQKAGVRKSVLSACELSSEGIRYPKKWSRSEWAAVCQELEGGNSQPVGKATPEDEEVGKLINQKAYEFSGKFVCTIMSQEAITMEDIPFRLSEQEKEIAAKPASKFILGRSGTGKTTMLLMQMVAVDVGIECASENLGFSFDLELENNCRARQLFLTASSGLCTKVSECYGSLLNYLRGSRDYLETWQVAGSHLLAERQSQHAEKRLRDLPTTFSPVFLTYDKLVALIDASLQNPYLRRNEKKEEVLVSDEVRLTENPYDNAKGVEWFSDEFWRQLDASLKGKLHPTQVWTEVVSVIRGTVESLQSPHGFLSEEQYLRYVKQRRTNSCIVEENVHNVYAIFLKYLEHKRSYQLSGKGADRIGYYDALDIVHYCFHCLRDIEAEGSCQWLPAFDFIYVDEAQDLCPAQLALLGFLCKNKRGFVCVGDTAQTIARGASFRFEALKDLFYTEILHCDAACVPKVEQLTRITVLIVVSLPLLTVSLSS